MILIYPTVHLLFSQRLWRNHLFVTKALNVGMIKHIFLIVKRLEADQPKIIHVKESISSD
jgi:hypothetical protein